MDTHTFLWWIDNDPHLSVRVRNIISDGENELFFSAASGWEMAIKIQIGKLRLSKNLYAFVTEELSRNHFKVMPIHLRHSLKVYTLPMRHRDPFDRILIAQSQTENLPLLTTDPLITQYGVETLW